MKWLSIKKGAKNEEIYIINAKTLSGILGHTNASFTLDTYTHVTTDMQKRASEIVEIVDDLSFLLILMDSGDIHFIFGWSDDDEDE